MVHDYGDVCQSVTDLAIEQSAPIANDDFRTLNRCLDDAIADAVTEFTRLRDVDMAEEGARESNERLGVLAHEVRNIASAITLALDVVKSGRVGMTLSAGLVAGAHLASLDVVMKNTHIVVAYDYTAPADLALERGVDIALRDPEHVNLHFVTVIDGGQTYQRADSIHSDLQTRLRALFERRRPGVRGVEFQLCVHVHIGKPAIEILRVAEDVSADLVIVGSHDRGVVGRLLLGSVSQVVLRDARCPVLIVRPKAYAPVELEKIVEVTSHGPMREVPHRYAYSSAALVRPAEWPLP